MNFGKAEQFSLSNTRKSGKHTDGYNRQETN
jgi:hypothetical protein